MTSQRFTDALSGADGTQALRLRYDVPPVYPDATVPVTVARPVPAPVVQVRIPVIDPRVAAEVQARATVRTRPPAAPRPPRVISGAGAASPAAPPSRAQAARAGYFQGPVPTAIGPAAPSQHRSFPAPPTASLQTAADRLRAQLGQFGTGNARSRPATPSSPQAGRRSSEPAPVFRPAPTQPARRTSGWAQGVLVVIILFLVVSGVGARIVDAILQLIQR